MELFVGTLVALIMLFIFGVGTVLNIIEWKKKRGLEN